MAKLFSDEFLRATAELRIIARQVPAAGRPAEQRSRDRGSGLEFRDFRAYSPGDDLRRVDWNVYRRSGRIFLRLFEEPEDLAVHILLDVSASMFFETPPRATAARQIAGLLAAISLGQLDRTSIYPFGADLVRPLVAPPAGQRGVHAALRFLEELGPAGPTDLVRAIGRLAALPLRSGLVVVISDFFDPQGIDAVTAALQRLRHRLLLVQVTRPQDGEPDLAGELTVVDCESRAELEVATTAQTRACYREAYERFSRHLLEFAARRNAAHLRLNADAPVLEQLGALFPNRAFVT